MVSITIVPFEQRHQSAVATLFDSGLRLQGDTPTLLTLQNWFVESKLKEDMGNVWKYYMQTMRGDDDGRSVKGLTFFVALMEGRVVGCVGIQSCGYPQEEGGKHNDVYSDDEISKSEICELVRMSVHSDLRGQRLGARLVAHVETWARQTGMKKMVVSTLSAMSPARRLYESCGYKLRIETEIENLEAFLGVGEWDKVTVAHYIKSL